MLLSTSKIFNLFGLWTGNDPQLGTTKSHFGKIHASLWGAKVAFILSFLAHDKVQIKDHFRLQPSLIYALEIQLSKHKLTQNLKTSSRIFWKIDKDKTFEIMST